MKNQAMIDVTSENNAVLDQLHAALSKGDENGLSEFMRESLRINPRLDHTEFLKRAMGNRTLTAFNRHYEASLMAVPLHGEILRPMAEFGMSKELMHTAKKRGMINGDDGLVILNAPLTRDCLQHLSLHQLYMCVPRMFARGTQQSNELILDITERKPPPSSADAMVLALVFWRKGSAKPLLTSDERTQRRFGELLGQYLTMERSVDGYVPRIWAQPLMPFFDATKALATTVVRRMADNIFREDIEEDYESIRLTTELMYEGDGRYRLIAHRQVDGQPSEGGFGALHDELLDGPISDLLSILETRCREYEAEIEIDRRFCTSSFSEDEGGNPLIDVEEIVFN